MVPSALTTAVPLTGARLMVSTGVVGAMSLASTLSTVVVPAAAGSVSATASGLTATTTAALAQLAQVDALPDLVISLGSGGSQTLDHGRIYWIDEVAYRDMDASALGFPPGVTPFLGEPASITLASGPQGQPYARLATGASVVSGEAYDAIAKKNGTTLDQVAILAGQKAIEKTPPGSYVKAPNGQWVKK